MVADFTVYRKVKSKTAGIPFSGDYQQWSTFGLTRFALPLGDFALAGPPEWITPLDGVALPPLNPGARKKTNKKHILKDAKRTKTKKVFRAKCQHKIAGIPGASRVKPGVYNNI